MLIVRGALYQAILKRILLSSCFLLLPVYLNTGFSVLSVLPDWLYLCLVMFLRSTMLSPIWAIRFKWTGLISIPIEAMLYGGGLISQIFALVSFSRFLVGYGYVLNLNPTQRTKETLSNRSVEIFASALISFVLCPSHIMAFFTQIALAVHAMWLSNQTLEDVCMSWADPHTRKAAFAELPRTISDQSRVPIEVWILAYFCASRKSNLLPQDLVSSILSSRGTVPWQLRRLVVRSITVDPSRAQMKSLLTVIQSDQILTPSSSRADFSTSVLGNMYRKGPKALISEEANERVVVNEAILGLALIYDSLGDRKFAAAFDKSVDAKQALDLLANSTSGGFK